MQDVIVNAHVVDSRNIGDIASSPVRYFDFDKPVRTLDLRALDPNFPEPKSGFGGSITLDEIRATAGQTRYHLIVGGGGLLFKSFAGSFDALQQLRPLFSGKWIAWGVGQQTYANPSKMTQGDVLQQLKTSKDHFNYGRYLKGFDLVGIRDIGFNYPWLPCASCMDPAFDQPVEVKHDVVVFSHRKFQIKLGRLPSMSHDTQDLTEVINFLGSGKTVITSSYHGAYWATLLGKQVIAFPFSTKFLTLSHSPQLYPVQSWNYSKFKFRPFKKSFLNKINIEFRYGDRYTCATKGWQDLISQADQYPDALQEHRQANQVFFEQSLSLLN